MYDLLSKGNISIILMKVPNCKVIDKKCLKSLYIVYQHHFLKYCFVSMQQAASDRVLSDAWDSRPCIAHFPSVCLGPRDSLLANKI